MDFAPDRPEFYLGDPHASFRRLRAEDPVHWYEEGGFWCITRHADVQEVSRHPRIYSSAHGTQLFEVAESRNAEAEMDLGKRRDQSGTTIIRMDPPVHNRYRKLVIGFFTPNSIQPLEKRIREIARESLDVVRPGEVVDFVESIAVPLPMLVIAELLGVPVEDRHDFKRWSDAMVAAGGGDISEATAATMGELFRYFREVISDRRAHPRDDLITRLVQSKIDGKGVDEGDLVMFFVTLLVAGNETTRNLIAGGTRALLAHPEQKRALERDPSLIPNAVEEMLRYIAPVRNFIRTAMVDTELRGRKIARRDRVALFYGSANRDEEVFGEDADRFDIHRASARRHLSFGSGEHLCLGAALARMEAIVLFEELLSRLPDFSLAGEVVPLPSILMNSIEHMPVRFEAATPARATA